MKYIKKVKCSQIGAVLKTEAVFDYTKGNKIFLASVSGMALKNAISNWGIGVRIISHDAFHFIFSRYLFAGFVVQN